MNENNIFKGECYLCRKETFIVRVDSWKSQKGIRGGWRNFCYECVKREGWKPNREKNICVKCNNGFVGTKTRNVCDKCCGVKK